ncbi:hypothetical protein KUV57_12905 [Epibacterium sp. DP7N7-1]|nr:hypothetical protein [Epibacterium sp. DP7N7-1]
MTENPNSMDQIPEGDIMEEEAPVARKASIPPGVKLTGIAVLALVGLGGAIFYTSSQQEAASQAPRAASLDSTPGGVVQQDSEVYRESVSELNRQRADRASQLGATSVPTPEVIMQPLEDPVRIAEVDIAAEEEEETKPEVRRPVVAERRVLPQPAPAPIVQERKRVPVQENRTAPVQASSGAAADEKENPYISRMSSQMTRMAASFPASEMSNGLITIAESNDEATDGATSSSVTPTGNATESAALLLRPGDVLYAETLTNVSSDMDSPVLAEIVSGEYKGARLTGSFSADKASDRMVVSFTNMTLEDGRVLSVNAFAVDGATAETAVASDVERRFVARYGPIIAASFISGYAQSRAQTAQTVVGTGDDATVATGQASAEQSLFAGVSRAASAVSSDILANAPKGPKIILRDGYPIGIIFIDGVEDVAQ